jgi:signal transduction histidine kinase
LSLPTDAFVLGRRVELLYRNVLLGQVVSIVNSSILTWVAVSLVGNSAIYGWWLAAIAIAGLRLGQAIAYRRAAPAQRFKNARWWRQRALWSATGAGLVWASGALLLMSQGNIHLQLLTGLVMSGMVAGAVPILAADRFIFRCYAIPVALAVAFGTLGSDPLHIAFTAMSLILLLAVTRSADFFHGALHETFQLEHEKDGLLAELAHASQVAERSNRAKTEFLANISHELRTPMNGILGMGDLLALEPLTPEQQELLLHQRESADRLMLLINHLIKLSALEAGHVRIKHAPFAVSGMLEGLLSGQQKAAVEKNLTLSLHTDPTLPEILIGDPDRLRQIFDHLVGNAIKFTEHGTVDISTKQVEPQGNTVKIEFSVADTGPGMTSEELDMISGLLVQGDGSSIRKHGGIGVGLPIARKLIELMGGELLVDCQVGKGCIFRFTLPFELPELYAGYGQPEA